MKRLALLAIAAALPALADTQFRAGRMIRADAPAKEGRCEIRLQVDGAVDVQVQGDRVFVRTLSGQDARDDGSECSEPLPSGEIEGFRFEVREKRNEMRLAAEPSRRNNFTAMVHIRDTAGGFGRYWFRLTWARQPEAPGFSRNNTVSFGGKGRGEASLNGEAPQRLGAVAIEVDQGGRLVATFQVERGRPLVFNGTVSAREDGRWKANVADEDHRLRGALSFSVDERGNVFSAGLEATDGRDRLRLTWERR